MIYVLVPVRDEAATGGLSPDLTLLLDVPADMGLARATQATAADRIEGESLAFHERVHAEFLRLAREHAGRIRIVDGTQCVDDVAAQIRTLVDERLRTR